MGFVYNYLSDNPILEIKNDCAYYHSLLNDENVAMAYLMRDNTILVNYDEITEIVKIMGNNQVIDSKNNSYFTDKNKIISKEGFEAFVEGDYKKTDILVAAATLLVLRCKIQNIRNDELNGKNLVKNKSLVISEKKVAPVEDVNFYKEKLEKALTENDGSAESIYYILNKESIENVLNNEQTSESLFLSMLSFDGFNSPSDIKTRWDGYTLSKDGKININDIQTNLNLINDLYTEKNGFNGVPNYHLLIIKFRKRSFAKKPENEYAKDRGYYIKNDGNEYIDQELMLYNRSKGRFCDSITGINGIPFDLKTDFTYTDQYKSDRNPTKKSHFYYENFHYLNRNAFEIGHYGNKHCPCVNEDLRHYNVFRGRFLNGNGGHNGVPDVCEKSKQRKKSHPEIKVRRWNKKMIWGIWILSSILSLFAMSIIFGIRNNDVVLGITSWLALQVFSMPGYLVAYCDLKNEIEMPYLVVLMVLGTISIGFCSIIQPECLISFIGLLTTVVIRITSLIY